MAAHFTAFTPATGLPITLYDVPLRTGVGLADETLAGLAELLVVTGLKDDTGDINRVPRSRSRLRDDFRLMSGDEAMALAFIAGGNGCISVTSNVAPGLCRNIFLMGRHGHIANARRWEAPLAKLTVALFAGSILLCSNTH